MKRSTSLLAAAILATAQPALASTLPGADERGTLFGGGLGSGAGIGLGLPFPLGVNGRGELLGLKLKL